MSIARFKVFAYSKNGKERINIQDSRRHTYIDKTNEDSYITDSYKGIFITADGLGGYDGADEASEYAVSFVYKNLISLKERIDTNKIQKGMIKFQLEDEINRTNERIAALSKIPEILNFGTTIDAMLITDKRVYGAHVGDGSVYKINDKIDSPRLLTLRDKDVEKIRGLNNFQNDLVYFNIVSNYLGIRKVNIQVYSTALNKSDIILIATDGLTKKVHPKEIQESLSNKNFNEGINILKQYCQKPIMMQQVISKLKPQILRANPNCRIPKQFFIDDTTFIVIARSDKYEK